MAEEFHSSKRTWGQKFRDAFRGLYLGIHDQSSFHVHLAATLAVVVIAAVLHASLLEWAVLTLSIVSVLAAEMMNTALEHLAKAVDRNHNPHIGAALDIGSAAVLLAACGAATVGTIVLGYRAWTWFGG